MRRSGAVRLARLATLAVSSTALLVGVPTAAIADSGTPPTFVRQLGGSGDADIYPSGAEVDPSSGAVVVADTGNDRIVKYTSTGDKVWDVGGFGKALGLYNSPRDIGIDSAGDVYVADTGNVRIVKLDGGTGAALSFWKGADTNKIGSPIGLSVSNDLVYVADAGKKLVRVYDTGGRHVRSFGSDGTCTFSALRDVDADAAGNVYVANYLLNNVLKLSPAGTCLTKWGTKGTGDGQFKNPYGVRVAFDPVDGAQRVYVADSNNNRIQKFTPTGGFVAAMGSTGSGDGSLGGLRRVAVDDSGRVYGADLWGWKISRWAWNGSAYAFDGRTYPDPVIPPAGELGRPITDTQMFNNVNQVAFEADGDLWAMDTVNQRAVPLENVASSQLNGSPCGKRGWQAGAFNWPRGIAVDQDTGALWIADTKQSRLQVIGAGCTNPVFLGKAGSAADQFNWPYSIAIRRGTPGGTDSVAFVADTKNNRIKAYDVETRVVLDVFGSRGRGSGRFTLPAGIAVAPDDSIFVADRGNRRIAEVSFTGGQFAWVGTWGTGAALRRPEGVAVGGRYIFVADTGRKRMVVLKRSDGGIRGVVTGTGRGGLDTPQSVSQRRGCIYLSDTYNDRILVYRYGKRCS